MTISRSVRIAPWTAVVATLVTLVAGCGGQADDDSGGADTLKVGILQLSQATLLDGIVGGFKSELVEQLPGRKITFDVKNAQGENSLVQSIAQQFKASDADLFAVAGTPGIIALAQLETVRPIFGLAMTDPVAAKVAKSLDAPGTNVTGSLGFIEPSAILAEVKKVQPPPQRIGTVYDPSNEASHIWIEKFRAALRADGGGLSLTEGTIAGSGDIAAAANSLGGRTDTWIIPPDTTVIAGLPAVGSAALNSKARLFITGGDAQTAGVLASIGPDYTELGRLAARKAAEVVNGSEPSRTAFARPTGTQWSVNQTTVDALSITLPPEAINPAAPSVSVVPSGR